MSVENKVVPYFPTEIKLSEDGTVPKEVQVLRVGKFSHPRYGTFEITPKKLAEFKKNFDEKVRRIDPAIDYKHDNQDVAAGWPKALTLKDNGTSLWFTDIEWTPQGNKVLADKEFRYFSPEFVDSWTDPETNKVYKNVLFGGGLTNRPFIKDMEPITKLGEEGVQYADDLQACVSSLVPDLIAQGHDQEQAVAIAYSKCGEKKMSELKLKGGYKMDDKAKIAELEKQVAELKAELEKAKGGSMQMSELETSNKKLSEEVKTLTEKIAVSEKEKAFNVLLSEGKVCAAQKEPYMKGDMADFAAKAQKVNLSESGNNSNPSNTDGDAEDRVLKLAEEKRKTDKSLSLDSAISLVLHENADLAKQVK